MKIILLKDVQKLGRKFDIKNVSDGHALNLLIPKGLAIAATRDSLKRFENERLKLEGERKIQDQLLAKNIEGLQDISITIIGKANEKGHLFAGLHSEDIVNEILKQTRLVIEPSSLLLEHPIKSIGEHTIEVKSSGKTAKFKIIVKAK